MPTNSPYGSYPTPEATDSDVVPVDLLKFGKAVEPWTIVRFANAAARTAAIASANAGGASLPQRGMICWLDTPGRHEWYDGTQWLPMIPAKRSWLAVWAGVAWDGVSTVDERMYNAIFTIDNDAGGWFHNWVGGAFPNGVLYVAMTIADTGGGILPVTNIYPTFASCTLSGIGGVAIQTNNSALPSGNIRRVTVQVVGW